MWRSIAYSVIGITTTDDRGRILTCNRAASTIIGLPANQVIGRDVVDVMQMSESVRARMATLTVGRSLKIDCQHRTPDGRNIDIGLTASTLTRIDRKDLERELESAGVRLVRIFPVARVFSDKWVVLGEKIGATRAAPAA